MSEYEAPTIVRLGSVAGFTRGDGNQWDDDGTMYINLPFIGRVPIPDLLGPGTS